MTKQEDFSRELVAGTLFGHRTFSITWGGYLAGVVFHDCWLPGLNVARCQRLVWVNDLATHDIPSMDCGCGFYAYFHPCHNKYSTGGAYQVDAIIEAWGNIVAGELGFRAEKAVIKAFVGVGHAKAYKISDVFGDIPYISKQEAMDQYLNENNRISI